jgi:hypothetical protein
MKILIKSTILISICISTNLSSTNLVKAQPVIDCDKATPTDVVVTSQGTEPVEKYCDFQEKLPQVFTGDRVEPQVTPSVRSKFGKPYNAKGSVCRDRGIDTICLTPGNASKLNELK